MISGTETAEQVGKTEPIPKHIGLHTELSSGITRKDFGKWTRWYQKDGNVQAFRLFKAEQNVRGGYEKDGSQGRVEVYSGGRDVVVIRRAAARLMNAAQPLPARIACYGTATAIVRETVPPV